jgi:S1-C subfamily serine protease
MRKFALQLICLAAISGLPVFAAPTTRPITTDAAALQAQTIAIAPKCIACTVGLVSVIQNGAMYSVGSGSGVLISADGLILTAGHVIEKPGTKITVRFTDGKVYQGVAVGLDHATDTGLVRITDPAPQGGWDFCRMAGDQSAAVGEWVLATGNPGSIVVDRDPPLRLGRVTRHDADAIDTNCALEPGDSGGPIFNLAGEVVGINSRIMTSSGINHPDEYLSLHVPISMFTSQMKLLLSGADANPDVNLDGRPHPRAIPGIGKRARAALQKLAADKDPEALQMLAEEKKTGKLKPTAAQMERLLKLAAKMDRGETAAAPATAPTLASAKEPATQPMAAAPTTQPVATSQIGVPEGLRKTLAPSLRQTLLKQYPDAIISDALLTRLMDRAAYNITSGDVKLAPGEQDLREMGITPENNLPEIGNGLPANRTSVEVGKTSLQTLALFAPALTSAGDCVVEIRDAGNSPVLLGSIVDSDGFIATKASDLPANPHVVLPDGRIFRARLIGKDAATDLALLKVNATGLTAVQFADATNSAAIPLGSWLAAPTANPNQPAVGVVSDSARRIPETFAHFEGEQKVVLGVGFTPNSLVITQITKGMPADLSGMKQGDEVYQLNGQAVADHDAFVSLLKKSKPGDKLSIMVHRDGKDLELNPVIGQAKATTQTANSVGEADNVAGGKLSKRRTNFPLAIQTDAAVWADQCGGPLINLQGQTVGITIARYDRVCTFALPAELVQKTVAKLRAN